MAAILDLIKRVTKDNFDFFETEYIPSANGKNIFRIDSRNGKVLLQGDCDISIAMALGHYLKNVMKIDWAWCGNREIVVDRPLILSKEPFEQVVLQERRVYLNYCTFCYSMAF